MHWKGLKVSRKIIESADILNLLLFIEELNVFIFKYSIAEGTSKKLDQGLLTNFTKSFNKKSLSFHSEFAKLFYQNSIKIDFDPSEFKSFAHTFFKSIPSFIGDRYKRISVFNNTNIRALFSLYFKLVIVKSGNEKGILTRYHNRFEIIKTLRAKNYSVGWESFDPIITIHYLLILFNGFSLEYTDSFLKNWIKKHFKIEHKKELVYTIPKICHFLNSLFFNADILQGSSASSMRSSGVSFNLLFNEIVNLLPQSEDKTVRVKQAIGIILFMRLSQMIVPRFTSKHYSEWTHKSSELPNYWLNVSATRLFKSSEIISQLFGITFSQSGLKEVFNGGLIPNIDRGHPTLISGSPGSGKTILSIHLLVDLVKKGGIGLYFSFEESYGAIIDKIASFALDSIDIFHITEDMKEKDINKLFKENSNNGKGQLLLYSHSRGKKFSILKVISNLSKLSQKRNLPFSVVIDSINALQMVKDKDSKHGDSGDFQKRLYLMSLIDAINTYCYFGFIISEELKTKNLELPYLVDTVLVLDFNTRNQTRWINIPKCRKQSYSPGYHLMKIDDLNGIRIYPSLNGIRIKLRQQQHATLSEERFIRLEKLIDIPEKSLTLIHGPVDNTPYWIPLFASISPSLLFGSLKRNDHINENDPNLLPNHILFVSFKLPFSRFMQKLRDKQYNVIHQLQKIDLWQNFCFPPSEDLVAEEIIGEINFYINNSKLKGNPVKRAVFFDTDITKYMFEHDKDEALFWHTLIDVLRTNAITSFFVNRSSYRKNVPSILESEVDYVIKLEMKTNKMEIKTRVGNKTMIYDDLYDYRDSYMMN